SLAHATRCSLSTLRRPPTPPLFPYTTLFRSEPLQNVVEALPYDRPLAIKPEQVHQVAYRGGPGDEHPSIDYLVAAYGTKPGMRRSEEHTSELQSRENLVCRLLLEKKKKRQEN